LTLDVLGVSFALAPFTASKRLSADTCPVPPDDLISVIAFSFTLLTMELLAYLMGGVRAKPVELRSLASGLTTTSDYKLETT